MKKRQLKSLELKKQLISTFVTGGKGAIPTTLKTDVTCGGICENSAIICD